MKKSMLRVSIAALIMGLAVPEFAAAQDQDDEIIVTASARIGVTQGGAQDIEFFKESVENGYLPAPAAITSEGLLSEYDLPLSGTDGCDQLFCLVAETVETNFVSSSKSSHLVGLGFATNLTHETWERDALSIVAVVDKSGSMGGEPLDLAKASMQEVLKNLRPGDRMAVVQYGSTVNVVVPMSDVETLRSEISSGIASIKSGGSTYMERGLELAYETAFAGQKDFDGTTRVVLFTDEQPNVGKTDSASFIGMAHAASERGVGLTTIGVADHFGADLANKLSAARGGNLFFVTDDADVKGTFGGDFDLMMTELAHDLEIRVKPEKGAKVEQVYGVPGEMIKYDRKGGAKLTVPSVFLSSNSGGIFLGVSGKPDMDVSMTYVDARSDEKSSDSLLVAHKGGTISPAMQRAEFLVDAYQVLQDGTRSHFFGGDLTASMEKVEQLQARLETFGDDPVTEEAEFLSNFYDILEKTQDEKLQNLEAGLRPEHHDPYGNFKEYEPVRGKWKVTSVRKSTASYLSGSIDIRKGDLIAFHLDDDRYDETEMFNLQRISAKRGEAEFEAESFGIDPKKKLIKLYESDIEFKYQRRGERLNLYPDDTNLVLTLERQ